MLPSVTIECGGSQDPAAHQLAIEGLQRYVTAAQLFNATPEAWPLDVMHHPVRLELDPAISIAYAEQAQADIDLCLRVDIEHFNFGEVHCDTALGWVSDKGWSGLCVVNRRGENLRDTFLREHQGRLYPAATLKLFMITSNPTIARSDCLCYAVKVVKEEETPVIAGWQG